MRYGLKPQLPGHRRLPQAPWRISCPCHPTPSLQPSASDNVGSHTHRRFRGSKFPLGPTRSMAYLPWVQKTVPSVCDPQVLAKGMET
ncbi:hypothetical protein GQ55_5G232700 [Panicum hallii var. hallii]|uniref:Uncharacterized protein n=1 Tax=Panicum hallii var. hallii TaxID=1504633 RepID=A0A2T7DJE8_9POAL|nr:hypothetical protein GQ55_5G232700 [Panicum hallii var. hallii]